MREDYEHLETEVFYHDEELTKLPLKAIVVGCNRSIGITVASQEDFTMVCGYDYKNGKELLCIHGPSSKYWKQYCRSITNYEAKYNELFDALVKEIEDGLITTDCHEFIGYGGSGKNMSCAYN